MNFLGRGKSLGNASCTVHHKGKNAWPAPWFLPIACRRVHCLKALFAQGLDVALILTQENNPSEYIWFDSVAKFC